MKFDWERRDKPFAPSAERNRQPILEALGRHLPASGRVLEIGSGTGQHAVHFARALPGIEWQTSDVAENLPAIRAWLDEAALPNLPTPIPLDVNGPWPELAPAARYDAAFTANTLHILGWAEVAKLFAGLDGMLAADAVFAAYGPFKCDGRHTSESNRLFDEALRARSPASAIRDIEEVDRLAAAIGLRMLAGYELPANNRLLVWQRDADGALGRR
jgi:cyclopropane fatty-acyl-phospholipid synthase-like methyltransferase